MIGENDGRWAHFFKRNNTLPAIIRAPHGVISPAIVDVRWLPEVPKRRIIVTPAVSVVIVWPIQSAVVSPVRYMVLWLTITSRIIRHDVCCAASIY